MSTTKQAPILDNKKLEGYMLSRFPDRSYDFSDLSITFRHTLSETVIRKLNEIKRATEGSTALTPSLDEIHKDLAIECSDEIKSLIGSYKVCSIESKFVAKVELNPPLVEVVTDMKLKRA